MIGTYPYSLLTPAGSLAAGDRVMIDGQERTVRAVEPFDVPGDAIPRDTVRVTFEDDGPAALRSPLNLLPVVHYGPEDGSSSVVFLAAVLPLFAVVTYALATLAGSLAVVA